MNDNLQVIETNNQRVLTTAQIAERYETTERRISENFNRNKERYTEGKHYYCLTGDVLREFKNDYANCGFVPGAKVNAFYLWTEKGALMLAKSLNTDKAWEAYEVLVDTYFSVHGLPQRDSYMIEDPVLRAQRWIEEQKEKQQLLTTVAVQYKQGKTWLLYQKYAGMGYTSTKTHTYHGDDGTEHAADPHTYWTQKGRLFIYDLLKSDDIYPLIERDAA